MDVLHRFPVRKSKHQKEVFRQAIIAYAEGMGYACMEEKGSFGVRNLVIGDPEAARYLVTAHYDTCARMLFPNFITPCNFGIYLAYQIALVGGIILVSGAVGALLGWLIPAIPVSTAALIVYWILLISLIAGPANPSNANDNTSGVVTLLEMARTMPENQRSKVCFVLFDLEEMGLLGSSAYRKKHKKASDNQIVLNLDCVGDGDHLLMFPTKKLKRDKKKLTALYKACGYFGNKDILVHEKGFSYYPSDQKRFPYGVGIAALRKSKLG